MKGLLTSLITVLTFTGLQAQSLPAAPKLVVGLTIDQLRTDYLEAFSSLYGEKGFKRLWKEGRVFHNAEYTFCGIDRASAIAAIYSGTTPSMNGIISQRWMDASTLRPVNSTDDTAFMGYYTCLLYTSPSPRDRTRPFAPSTAQTTRHLWGITPTRLSPPPNF